MVLFYHNNYYIGFSQQKAYWFLVSLFLWCGFVNFVRRPLVCAQPPRWKIIYYMFLFIIFWNAKIIYYSYVFKEAKLAKFIRYEALWKLYIFYHKVLGDVVKWWRFWGLWGTLENREVVSCEVVKLKYFAFWRDSSLCCPSFRMTRFCFLLTIRNLNYFWSTKI